MQRSKSSIILCKIYKSWLVEDNLDNELMIPWFQTSLELKPAVNTAEQKAWISFSRTEFRFWHFPKKKNHTNYWKTKHGISIHVK